MTTHEYRSDLAWAGRTETYEGYSRTHEITMAGASATYSADKAFLGDPALPNPEVMLVAAASSCQLLSFLAVAARSGVVVTSYTDSARGYMPGDVTPMRLTRIVLRPHVTVATGTAEKVERLLHKAHEQCYIANSLTAEVAIEPTIEVA